MRNNKKFHAKDTIWFLVFSVKIWILFNKVRVSKLKKLRKVSLFFIQDTSNHYYNVPLFEYSFANM